MSQVALPYIHRLGVVGSNKLGRILRGGTIVTIIALASKIAKIIWHMISKQAPFKQPTAEEYEAQKHILAVRKIQQQITQLNISAQEISVVV